MNDKKFYILQKFLDLTGIGITEFDNDKIWKTSTHSKLMKDVHNFRQGKPLEEETYFRDLIYSSKGKIKYASDKEEIAITSLKAEKYREFLFSYVFINSLPGPNRAATPIANQETIGIMLSNIDKKYNILNFNGQQFNNLFPSVSDNFREPIWYSLNDNPGAFWQNTLSNEIKSQIAFHYAGHLLLGGSKRFDSIYDELIDVPYNLGAPYLPSAGGRLQSTSKDNDKFTIKTASNTRLLEFVRSGSNLITLINSNFFFTPSQVEGIKSVKEAGDTFTITKETRKQLVEDAKTDTLFNVFAGIRFQKPASKIYQTLTDVGDTGGVSGFNEAGVDIINIVRRPVGDLGEITATDEQLKEFIESEDSDFSDNITQCILISDLYSFGKFRKNERTRVLDKSPVRPDGIDEKQYYDKYSYPYGGRIYCLDNVKDKTFLNCLNSNYGMNQFIKHCLQDDFATNIKYDFLLYKVEESDDGKSIEYPFYFEGDKPEGGSTPSVHNLTGSFVNDQNILNAGELREKVFPKISGTEESKNIHIKNVNISISGDTVATVKSNIDVKITFSVPTLDAIQAIFKSSVKLDDGTSKDYEYSLTELLSYNVGSKYDGTQAARALNTSFLPKKNRLVLKITPEYINKFPGDSGDEKDLTGFFLKKFNNDDTTEYAERMKIIDRYFKNSNFMLDLVLVNYSVNRSFGKDAADEVTIEYKGFTKSFLNEPFCDILLDNESKEVLAKIEQETIDDLSKNKKYCNIPNIRKRLSAHYDDMNKKRSELIQNRSTTLLDKLIQNNKIYRVSFPNNIWSAIAGNVDKKTKKIIDPKKVYDLVHDEIATGRNIVPIQNIDTTAVPNILESPNNVDFFYFGDLLDVAMDFIYGEAKFDTFTDAKGNEQKDYSKRKRDQLRDNKGNILADVDYNLPAKEESSSTEFQVVPDVDGTLPSYLVTKPADPPLVDETYPGFPAANPKVSSIKEKFANFPLKIILPSFYPNVYDSSTDSFNTSVNKKEKISIADVPISIAYFQQWYEEEITKPNTKVYPLATFISRILNSIINNVLSDNCYNMGNIQRKYYNVRSDFGAFSVNKSKNDARFLKNVTNFDILQNDSRESGKPFFSMKTTSAPYLKKSIDISRNEHCNYLVVYEQHSTFDSLDDIDAQYKPTKIGNTNYYIRSKLEENNIPEFQEKRKEPYSGKQSNFTTSITFSKTELPKATEIRFYNDGLNELSALSAVHDASVETVFLPTIYPGMLCWIDPDFVDGPEIYGSIAWTTGIGGFHLVTKVSHTFDVNARKILKDGCKTTIEAKYVANGSGDSTVKYREQCQDFTGKVGEPDNNGEEVPAVKLPISTTVFKFGAEKLLDAAESFLDSRTKEK